MAEGAFTDLGQAVGRTVVVGVPARQVLTASALLGAEGQVAPGQVALPVAFGVASTSGPLGGTVSRLVLLDVSSAQAASIVAAMSVSAVSSARH